MPVDFVLDGPGAIPGGGGGGYFFLLHVIQIGPRVQSASCKMSTGAFPDVKKPSVGLATLPLPSAVAANMWTFASTTPLRRHGL